MRNPKEIIKDCLRMGRPSVESSAQHNNNLTPLGILKKHSTPMESAVWDNEKPIKVESQSKEQDAPYRVSNYVFKKMTREEQHEMTGMLIVASSESGVGSKFLKEIENFVIVMQNKYDPR